MPVVVSERSDGGTVGVHEGAMAPRALLREADAQPAVARAVPLQRGPDIFRLGIAIVGLTAYLGLPAALVIWLVSGLMKHVAAALY